RVSATLPRTLRQRRAFPLLRAGARGFALSRQRGPGAGDDRHGAGVWRIVADETQQPLVTLRAAGDELGIAERSACAARRGVDVAVARRLRCRRGVVLARNERVAARLLDFADAVVGALSTARTAAQATRVELAAHGGFELRARRLASRLRAV